MSVKLSIITPSYNQAAFLDETLRSVISQRDQIHEYFVMDGGSTDGSVDIIKKHERDIDFWISEKDKGQSDAIHRGFQKATGDVLFWLNSDDVLLPGVLQGVRRAFDENPRWDALTGYLVKIDERSRIISLHRTGPDRPDLARRGVLHVAQPTCFFRKKLYDAVGGLDLSLHVVMDTDLWFRMFRAHSIWGHIPDFLGAFRVHADSKTTSWQKELADELAQLAVRYPEYAAKTFNHALGLLRYRIGEILSGRRPRVLRETRKHFGQGLDDFLRRRLR
jgi:glycosyltransferase involved in cell wall biosynthesis